MKMDIQGNMLVVVFREEDADINVFHIESDFPGQKIMEFRLSEEMMEQLEARTYLGMLSTGCRQFEHADYQDKTGSKTAYVLQKDLFGYKKGAYFFDRGDYLFPENIKVGQVGFDANTGVVTGYFKQEMKTIDAGLVKSGMIVTQEKFLTPGEMVSVSGIGIFKVKEQIQHSLAWISDGWFLYGVE